MVAYTWMIEFQKRGLPHAHILLVLDAASQVVINISDNNFGDIFPQELWSLLIDSKMHECALLMTMMAMMIKLKRKGAKLLVQDL